MMLLTEMWGRFAYWFSHDQKALTDLRDWVNVVATLAIAFYAAFGERFRAWQQRPKIKLIVQTGSPHSDLTAITAKYSETRCFYFRLLVANFGKTTAKNVEVFVQRVDRCVEGQRLQLLKEFPPMNLVWSHSGGVSKDLSPGMSKFIDFGWIAHPEDLQRAIMSQSQQFRRWRALPDPRKTVFTFELEVKPNHLSHIVDEGIYQVRLLTSGGNFDPFETTIEMQFSGRWIESEDDMYSEGLILNDISHRRGWSSWVSGTVHAGQSSKRVPTNMSH